MGSQYIGTDGSYLRTLINKMDLVGSCENGEIVYAIFGPLKYKSQIILMPNSRKLK